MGRLFWKFFLVFWLVLVTSGSAVGFFFWRQIHGLPPREARPPVLMAAPKPSAESLHRHRMGFRPSAWLPIGLAFGASLASSALLAWYLSKPIRSLSWAFDSVARGRLDTRVAPRMGRRRDEIADLGSGFDRMTGQLEVLIDGQRRLLHDVSHELRSPLARLQAAIGLARQSPARRDPAKVEVSLDRIEREAVRLEALVGELLTLSHLEAATGGGPRQSVDLVELVASIADDARFEAEAAGRSVRFAELRASGAGEVIAQVEAEAVHRAFENVLRNAVKFTAPGTEVEVTAGVTPEGDAFEVRVADRGPGVPEADLERIFEPFYRADNGSATSGTGLGLAIARRAVELHGGTIRAANREGGGLEMELRLPVDV